jgi:hypothetical protein
MATGKRAGKGIKDRNLSDTAGIRPYKLDATYASPTAFLAAKSAEGVNSSSAEAGDWYIDSTTGERVEYDAALSAWVGGKNVAFKGAHCAPVCSIKAGSAATGADTTLTQVNLGNAPGLPHMVVYNTGANTTRIAPQTVVDANCTDGLELPSTNTDNVGGTITFGAALTDLAATTGAKTCFTVGTDAAFFMEVKLGIPDVSDYDVLGIGFVEPAAAYVSAIDTTAELQQAYDEKAMWCLADNAGDIDINTSLAGVDVNTDATVTDWVDDAVKTLRINVSAAGVVTYQLWAGATEDTSTGAVAFTFADATVVTPCIIYAKGAAAADTPPIIEHVKFGHQ